MLSEFEMKKSRFRQQAGTHRCYGSLKAQYCHKR